MNAPKTSHFLTLNKAAEHCGRSKGTLSKAISKGLLSVHSKQGNSFLIDPAELNRWEKLFPVKNSKTNNLEQSETTGNTLETSDLQVEVEVLRARLTDLESANSEKVELLTNQIDDLKEQRDKWEQQASNQTRLLTHEQERGQRLEQQPQGIFRKLFGAG